MCIYCITNQINLKKYVGKTSLTIEKRFKQHKHDSKYSKCANRALYKAFNKYGIENFTICVLEEVKDKNLLNEREIYWIKQLNTYHLGYNITKGGDGKFYVDTSDVEKLWNSGLSTKQIAKQINCCVDTVRTYLHNIGITNLFRSYDKKSISQFDLNGNFITDFESLAEAAKYIKDKNLSKGTIDGILSHLTHCCQNKLKTAYKYIWRYKL